MIKTQLVSTWNKHGAHTDRSQISSLVICVHGVSNYLSLVLMQLLYHYVPQAFYVRNKSCKLWLIEFNEISQRNTYELRLYSSRSLQCSLPVHISSQLIACLPLSQFQFLTQSLPLHFTARTRVILGTRVLFVYYQSCSSHKKYSVNMRACAWTSIVVITWQSLLPQSKQGMDVFNRISTFTIVVIFCFH